MRRIEKLEIREVLQYEIHSHWFASYISNPFLQEIMAKYFAWKVSRKYKRYSNSLEIRNKILKG